ncbi:unnamed protein product [Caenorhabditis brenneri]
MNLSFVIFFAVIAFAQCRSVTVNAAVDAEQQKDKPLRCWEESNGKFELSEAKYPMCQHMTIDTNSFLVSGVELESDDYTNILAMFSNSGEGFAFLNICVQEAYALRGPLAQATVSFRCLCKRDGCNYPGNMDKYLAFNKGPISLQHE